MNIEVGKKYQAKMNKKYIMEVLFIADKGDPSIFAVYDTGTTSCYSRADIEDDFQPYEEPEEKPLEERIKEAYPDYEVKVCEWSANGNWCYKDEYNDLNPHYTAVSKCGFDGYVYENVVGALYVLNDPFDGKSPLACLFEEVKSE